MSRTKRKPDELILKLIEAKEMASKKNRWRTHHAIDDALKIAGWELADILLGKQKIGDKK